MPRYTEILRNPQIRTFLVKLEPLSIATNKELSAVWPSLPHDYLDFLAEVGYSVIGQRQYMLYSGPTPLSELLADACDPDWSDFLSFGDTLGGTCHAFDPSNSMRVLAIDLDIREVEEVNDSFESFISALLRKFVEET